MSSMSGTKKIISHRGPVDLLGQCAVGAGALLPVGVALVEVTTSLGFHFPIG